MIWQDWCPLIHWWYRGFVAEPVPCPLRKIEVNLLDQVFLYHPGSWEDKDWRAISRLPLQDVWFPAADGARLFGWYVETAATSPVLLWCHGNGGNIIHRLDNLRRLYELGFSALLFDYRGYGKSQKLLPSESGLYQDALGAYDYLTRTRRIRSERVICFGRSLGAAVAGELATQKPAAGLILESPFPSVEAIARFYYGGLPVHWLLGGEYRLIDRLPQLSLSKLIIHGNRDHIIPVQFGRQVFDAAKPPKEWYEIDGADHNDTYVVGGAVYFRRIAEFARQVLSR